MMMLAGLIAVFIPRTFLELDEVSILTDGFASQVMYVLNVLGSGSDLSDEKALFFVHMVRTLVAVVFQFANAIGGPVLEVLLLSLLVWPVLDLFVGRPRRLIGLVLFFLVFLISFRSVLVCVSVGYLFLYQLRSKKNIFLLASFFFSSLSSGAVLLCVLLLARNGRQVFTRGVGYLTYAVLMVTSLAISLADKFDGFNAGDAGYEATIGNSTGIVAAISRNTIIVSILEGNYVRAAVYGFIAVMLLVFLVSSFLRPQTRWYRYILVAGLPVLGMEGLGVVALIIPLLMIAADVYLPANPPVGSEYNDSKRYA
jgi:hypothetical protein